MHTIFIDYLQYSAPFDEDDLIDRHVEIIPPLQFFKRGYKDEIGARYYFGHKKTENAAIVLSGSTMHNQRVIGWEDADFIEGILSEGGKVKRLDIAITDYVDEDLITPSCVVEAFYAQEITGTLSGDGIKFIAGGATEDFPSVETTYIGDLKRRGKRGIFRAYDKGLEMKIAKDIISRLELEERKENAHSSAKRIAGGASLTQVLQSRLQFNSERFKRLFEDEPIDISRGDGLIKESVEEKMNRRWQWLMAQVAPSLREAVEYERKNSASDERIMKFLRKSGIIG